jgi:hypothetical protein
VDRRDRRAAHRYRCRVSEIPWWGLPLIAAVFALVGAVVAQLVTVRNESARKRAEKSGRWYEERKSAYVGLLAAYERTTLRLRRGFAAGVTEPDPLAYLDEIGAPLTEVRLLASGPVRSAALAVHLLLEDLHGPRPKPVPGRETEQHFLERLAHIPLLMHEFEVAVREELEIDANPPPPIEEDPDWRRKARILVGRPRRSEPVGNRS